MKGLGILALVLFVVVLTCAWWASVLYTFTPSTTDVELFSLVAGVLTLIAAVTFVTIVCYCMEEEDDNSIMIIKGLLFSLLTAIYTSSWWAAALWGYNMDTSAFPLLWVIPAASTGLILLLSGCWIEKHWND